jgi:hypothetical protein
MLVNLDLALRSLLCPAPLCSWLTLTMPRHAAVRNGVFSLLAICCLTTSCAGHRGRMQEIQRRARKVQPCKEVTGTPPLTIMTWYMIPSLGYLDDTAKYRIQGITYTAKKITQSWGFKADMVYTAIARYDPHDDYILSVKGKPGGDNTDGFYYVTFQRKDESTLGNFYISHFDECTFKPKSAGELLDIDQVWINQYQPNGSKGRPASGLLQ